MKRWSQKITMEELKNTRKKFRRNFYSIPENLCFLQEIEENFKLFEYFGGSQ
ncbi:hypothetical protein [Desulfurobacterium sp.]|uniref:hypothetical protein n=1 Tax=Desulfurobacterium sp. TaxID=2004706 RepID=UPI002617FE1C|nr:hypothetical protein [Desulfurobacterium sp.]